MTPALIEPNADPSIILHNCTWLPLSNPVGHEEMPKTYSVGGLFMPPHLHLALTGLCKFFQVFFLFCFLGGVGAAAINLMKFRQSFSLFYFRLRWWINWCVWGDDALPSRCFCHEDCAATLPDGFWWRRCAWKCEIQTVFTSLPNSWTLDVKIIADLNMKLELFFFFSKPMLSRNDHRRWYTQTKKNLVNSFFFHLFCLIRCRPWCGLIRSLHDWDSSGKCQPTLAWPNAKTQCLHRSNESPYTWNYNIFLALK